MLATFSMGAGRISDVSANIRVISHVVKGNGDDSSAPFSGYLEAREYE